MSHFKPGPQMPGKYPQVGPEYQQWGEIPGWLYDPRTDSYVLDPKQAPGYKEPPKPPGLGQQIAPVALGLGVGQMGKEVASSLVQGKLPFGLGAATPTSTAGASTAAATPAIASGGTSGGYAAGGQLPVWEGTATPATNPGGLLSGIGNVGGTMGLGGAAALGAAGAAGAAGFYNYGGKEVLSGEGKTEDYVDAALQSNPVTAWVNPVLDAIGLGSVGGILGGKSTAEYQKERRDELGAAGQDFMQKADALAKENENTWQEGKYKGEKWSFDKALDLAKDDPTTFIGVLGNWKAFGDKWANVPLEKQQQIVSKLIDEGLYTSDKGDVLISPRKGHEKRAQEIYDEVMGITDEDEEEDIIDMGV